MFPIGADVGSMVVVGPNASRAEGTPTVLGRER